MVILWYKAGFDKQPVLLQQHTNTPHKICSMYGHETENRHASLLRFRNLVVTNNSLRKHRQWIKLIHLTL